MIVASIARARKECSAAAETTEEGSGGPSTTAAACEAVDHVSSHVPNASEACVYVRTERQTDERHEHRHKQSVRCARQLHCQEMHQPHRRLVGVPYYRHPSCG